MLHEQNRRTWSAIAKRNQEDPNNQDKGYSSPCKEKVEGVGFIR